MEKKTKKTKKDPIQVLLGYMEQQGLRLVDFFNKLDTDGSMSLSRKGVITKAHGFRNSELWDPFEPNRTYCIPIVWFDLKNPLEAGIS